MRLLKATDTHLGSIGGYRIKCSKTDSKRDQIAADAAGEWTETLMRKLFNILYTRPELSVAECIKMSGLSRACLKPDGTFLNLDNSNTGFTVLFKDFSVLIKHYRRPVAAYDSFDSIFEFIDGKEYEKYPENHPIHELVAHVRSTFGFEHIAWWHGTHPFTGLPRTDPAWLAEKAKQNAK